MSDPDKKATDQEINAALAAMQSNYRLPTSLPREGSTWAQEDRPTYGAKVPATLDMDRRPHVVNADGSESTVRSMGFQDQNGDQVLVPTVGVKGNIMSDDEAVDNYYRTGQHLGKYGSIAESNAAAEAIHNSHAANPPEDTLGGSGGEGMTVAQINEDRKRYNEAPMTEDEIDDGAAYQMIQARRAIDELNRQ